MLNRLRRWLCPDLAIDLHNDNSGKLHLSRPGSGHEQHLAKMQRFEHLMLQHTWFTEGSTGADFHNAGTLGEGWLERYGIDAAVHEFNANWVAGLNDYPSGRHWMRYGEQLARVFDRYFEVVKP